MERRPENVRGQESVSDLLYGQGPIGAGGGGARLEDGARAECLRSMYV